LALGDEWSFLLVGDFAQPPAQFPLISQLHRH